MTHYFTYTACDAHHPEEMHLSRTTGGYRRHELDRLGRPPRWEHCDADEFLRDLDAGRIKQPPEPEPQTEAESLRRALRRLNVSETEAAARIGENRATVSNQLSGRYPLRPDMAGKLRQLIETLSSGG